MAQQFEKEAYSGPARTVALPYFREVDAKNVPERAWPVGALTALQIAYAVPERAIVVLMRSVKGS